MLRSPLYHVFGDLLTARRAGAAVRLHQHRCGSSVVGTMLAEHPDVSWHGEVLSKDMRRWAHEHGTREGWVCDPAQVVKQHLRRVRRGWFVCEVTTHNMNRLHLDCEQVVEMLRELGVSRFIVQERRNHLRRYISSRIAAASKNWHNEEEKQKPTRIYLDPDDAGMDDESGPLLERLRSDTAHLQEMLRATRKYDGLHLVYEDHVEQDPRVAYSMLCEHLDLPAHEIAPKLVKENPFPVKDMLENYDEVAETLRGTAYEWMLTA